MFFWNNLQGKKEMYHNHHPSGLPCLHCHPHSFIRLVQHLIERCLILHMSRDQCVKALKDHAGIRPLITLTVWRELLKENKDFFNAYFSDMMASRPSFTGRYAQTVPTRSGSGKRKPWTKSR